VQVRTYTSAWNLRTKIYAFDDLRIPVRGGITIPQLAAGVVCALIWIPLCIVIGLSHFVNTGFAVAIMIAPPVFVTLKADTPIAHEKTIEEWLTSWITRQTEPKRLASLVEARDNRPIVLTARRWVSQDSAEYGREPPEVGR
jgi:hypothetical protein